MDCDKHNDRSAKSDQDVSDLLVGQRARSKVLLGLVSSRSEPRQFLITQRRNSFIDLDGVEVSGLQSFLSLPRREKLLNPADILLPRAGNRESSLLKLHR